MADIILTASSRTETGKGAARKIRQAGDIPAVIYGHNREPQSLVLNARETEKLIRGVAVSSTAFELHIDGKPARTLIREIQRHPFKRTILHMDFQELVAGETVTVKCPIVYVGTPEGVRLEGGILDQIMHELQIAVDPSNIPNHIDVDISTLKVGKSLHVSDITVPAGGKVMDDASATLCIVQAPKQAPDAPADGAAEPELIRKPKPDDK
jgi:large subunit ribosomal protein L25